MIGARGRALAAAAGLLLGACHKRDAGADTLDIGADARAKTAAKTLADLQAAAQASGTPLAPRLDDAPRPVAPPAPRDEPAPAPAADDAPPPVDNADATGG